MFACYVFQTFIFALDVILINFFAFIHLLAAGKEIEQSMNFAAADVSAALRGLLLMQGARQMLGFQMEGHQSEGHD